MTAPAAHPASNSLAMVGLIFGVITVVFASGRFVGLDFLWGVSFLTAVLALAFGIAGVVVANQRSGIGRSSAVCAIILSTMPVLLPFLLSAVFGIAA